MSHETRASEHAASSKGKGKAPAFSRPHTADPGDIRTSTHPDKVSQARLLRFRAQGDDRTRDTEESYNVPSTSTRGQPCEAVFDSLPDLAARVAHLQTQVKHVQKAYRSGTLRKTIPSQDLRSAKDALRLACQGVQNIEQEIAARIKGNDARISRMEKKLLTMRRGA